MLEGLLKRTEDKEGESDDSYIELSNGRLYYFDLLESVETLSAEPLYS